MPPRALDLRLYLLVDCHGATAIAPRAIDGGVTAVQLRDPAATGLDLYRAGQALVETMAGTGVTVLVNDRLDVALAVGADGVHLGQSDLPAQAARELGGPDLVIGWSVAGLTQLDALDRLAPDVVDYLGVGPVYATGSKPDAGSPIGGQGIRLARQRSRLPVVGIGGIQAANAGAVVTAGAAGVAVIAAICDAPDPAAAARQLRQAIEE